MTRFTTMSLMLVAALAACGTPQEMCIQRATRDLRTVDHLIAEIETNLSRGFRYQTDIRTRHHWVFCSPRMLDDDDVAPRFCSEEEEYEVRYPVPIDPVVEQRTLANLKARRAALIRPANAGVAACKQAYPE